MQEPVFGRRLMAYVEAKVQELGKQLKERKSRGGAAVEIGGDAYRVRLHGRRPAELEKSHQSKSSENGAVTNIQNEDPGGERDVHRKRQRSWSK
ncbi:hypothetical protein N9L68_04630 [bacterium]|nr:hypothetical protein [bacterium]